MSFDDLFLPDILRVVDSLEFFLYDLTMPSSNYYET